MNRKIPRQIEKERKKYEEAKMTNGKKPGRIIRRKDGKIEK